MSIAFDTIIVAPLTIPPPPPPPPFFIILLFISSSSSFFVFFFFSFFFVLFVFLLRHRFPNWWVVTPQEVCSPTVGVTTPTGFHRRFHPKSRTRVPRLVFFGGSWPQRRWVPQLWGSRPSEASSEVAVMVFPSKRWVATPNRGRRPWVPWRGSRPSEVPPLARDAGISLTGGSRPHRFGWVWNTKTVNQSLKEKSFPSAGNGVGSGVATPKEEN